MEKEDVNLTIAKVSAAAGLVGGARDENPEGSRGEAIEAAAKYLKEVFSK